jgi:hypothetical protein
MKPPDNNVNGQTWLARESIRPDVVLDKHEVGTTDCICMHFALKTGLSMPERVPL